MHLAQTRTIPEAGAGLVVWAEGSTGSVDADPILNPDVDEAIAAEARRIHAAFLVGGDRPISESEWINAVVAWDRNGQGLGEYRKRHPVPFGEYIPARPLFDWIPDLSQVPRDMIRGDGPRVFDFDFGRVGTVISFEAAFGRYGRDEAKAGAQLLVVASNEGSYEFTSVSDQFIAMSRMRAAELGVDVVHAAVTGKSTFVTAGGVIGDTTEFLDETVLYADLRLSTGLPTIYTRWGEWVQTLAALIAATVLLRSRSLVSRP
jgi:apolipoprotein N-acyltransferase